MVTISSALANYENALQAARSLWMASDCAPRGGDRPGRPGRPALYAAKEGGRNRSCADLAEAAEAAGRAQG